MKRREICGGLDTSVLVRLLTGQPAGLAGLAREYLAEVEEAGACVVVSNLVVSEAYFECQYHYGIAKSETLRGLLDLLAQPTVLVQPALLELLGRDGLSKAKPGFVDRLIHSEYASGGVTMITFEKSARRLSGTRVLSE